MSSSLPTKYSKTSTARLFEIYQELNWKLISSKWHKEEVSSWDVLLLQLEMQLVHETIMERALENMPGKDPRENYVTHIVDDDDNFVAKSGKFLCGYNFDASKKFTRIRFIRGKSKKALTDKLGRMCKKCLANYTPEEIPTIKLDDSDDRFAKMLASIKATPATVDSKVDHPEHYNKHPSGVECIDIIEGFSFCVGNAIKYLWRAEFKGDPMEDLKKAKWYIEREIERKKNG